VSPYEEEDGCNPLEVRRWRFIANVPPTCDPPIPVRLPSAMREPAGPLGIMLVVLDRGLVDDEAILGKPPAPLRTVPFGVPEARFLS
jgi:hypothetical protein